MSVWNLAIIAHVDHGKTKFIDALWRQSDSALSHQDMPERMMDSLDLERSRGITILSKCTSFQWHGHHINIVDTPGHADFGGEVERVLSMVRGVLVLVDAAEGVMPQTKFVLEKALRLGKIPIVIINKMDRPDARAEEVHCEILDLFQTLASSPEQMEFVLLYASGREGWCIRSTKDTSKDLSALFETVMQVIPPEPVVIESEPFSFLVTLIEKDNYLGKMVTGRIESGCVKVNQPCHILDRHGAVLEKGRITKILKSQGLERLPLTQASSGDIVTLAGFDRASVAHTVCDPEVTTALEALPIDPPTLSIVISENTSPFKMKEASKTTSRLLAQRLADEAETNVALQVKESPRGDAFEVFGRGELQLGILLETLRREGFEFSVGRPKALVRDNPETGVKEEPFEEATIDVNELYSGQVIEKLSLRRGEMMDMQDFGHGKVRIIFLIPSRGLVGYHGTFLTDTRGTGILNKSFAGYFPCKGPIEGRRQGVLISNGQGDASAYALAALEKNGIFFISEGTPIYEGMIIGENSKENDLEINAIKVKQLTNVRAAGKDDAIRLSPPKLMTLEEAMTYIQDDECLEVTPKSLRLRKNILKSSERKASQRSGFYS